MANLKSKRVLVTGGTGFIGSHLVKKLLEQGAEVILTARPQSSFWRLQDVEEGRYKKHTVNLQDEAEITATLTHEHIDTVYHIGALVPEEGRTPEEYLFNNTEITRKLFNASKKVGVPAFITLGSANEYGNQSAPFLETYADAPLDPYGKSKSEATRYLEHASSGTAVRCTVLRPPAVYGEQQAFRGMFIPNLIRTAILKTEFVMSPGEQVVDFLYVEDLVQALLLAGERTQGSSFEIINVGSGTGYPLKEVAYAIADGTGSRAFLQIGAKPYREGEPFTKYLSIEKAWELLSWKPTTSLQQGLKKTTEWYQEHQHLFPRLMV